MKLWADGDADVDAAVERFLAGDDVTYDQELLEVDVLGSIAHARMLHEQGYLDADELDELHAALLQVLDDPPELEAGDEDVHTAVENAVTDRTEAGKKLHTGRSRNDQVLADTRLYTKRELVRVADAVLDLVDALRDLGDAHADLVMPGYTHMRQAMPTTAQVWLESHAAALLDDLELLDVAYDLNDQSPLGAAAGYGTTLDIDREMTADLLGFDRVQANPTYAVSSRGTIELAVLDALTHVMLDLDRLANDLILRSTAEYGHIMLPEDYCTGSSIMPQKSNPDVLELVKGKAASVAGARHQVESTVLHATSGYNRDTQETKPALVDALGTVTDAATIMADLVPGISFDAERIAESMDDAVFAAHTANTMVADGVPFRKAYRTVKEDGEYVPAEPGDIPAPTIPEATVAAARETWMARGEAWDETVERLVSRDG